ncbi:protein CHROMATIN REMODELING 4-like isoform X2 [Carex littledalei]|uniref:Protein CHROMATIN REMODELING 4-like isoform X2 n=1 Tax=Carex littledalei TaxID=544730 RepID=A0A833VCF7_9POAL|nr:protein CHROMATIN REMODELING 4-like isoform X2 [Carex littledalei]
MLACSPRTTRDLSVNFGDEVLWVCGYYGSPILLPAMGVLADSLSIAPEMSEESSSGNSIIQRKAIPNRKRTETAAVPDPSIVDEDILVHSDHSMSSHSARTTLERNLDESPFGAQVTGDDGALLLSSVVLVPLSTLPNWLAEFSLWAPHLNVVEYHGGAKARDIIRQYEWHATRSSKPTKSYKFNVLLTTYEMVLADASYLCNVPWEVLIVDEGHRLKNSKNVEPVMDLLEKSASRAMKKIRKR